MPPRRSRGGPVEHSPVPPVGPAIPPQPVSPLVSRLRQDWRFAAVSAFCSSFLPRLTGLDFDVDALETDLDTTEDQVLPDLMSKLLFSLTFNTHINSSNWQEHLLRQYLKRSPDTNQLGTLDDPRPWAELGLGDKVAAMHNLCEWQMVDPTRFRGLVVDENLDAEARWRMDPIGYDRNGHAYYVFLDNRLWKQHAPPVPPRPVHEPTPPPASPSPSKGKGKASDDAEPSGRRTKSGKLSHKKRSPSFVVSADEADADNNDLPPRSSSSRRAKRPVPTSPPSSSRRAPSSRNAADPSTSTPAKKARTSRRSRGEDDPWQEIPEEWLSPAKSDGEGQARRLKGTGLASDEGSDLSDLSEDELSELSEVEADDAGEEEEAEEVAAAENADEDGAQEQEKPVEMDIEEPAPPAAEEAEVERPAPSGEPVDTEDAAEQLSGAPAVVTNGEPINADPKVEDEAARSVDDESKVQSAEDGAAPVAADGDAEMVDAEAVPAPNGAVEPKEDEEEDEVQLAKRFVPEYVEWEAVCTCRWEWENYPLQWSGSTDPDEKALFELIVIDYIPILSEVFRESEQKAAELAAVKARKRSSRIQAVEDERAETERTRAARSGVESRMDKVRREEERKAREDYERNSRERIREEKLREREDRALQREETLRLMKEDEEAEKIREAERREERTRMRNGEIPAALLDDNAPSNTTAKKANGTAENGSAKSKKGSASAAKKAAAAEVEEEWILSCDICGFWGKNPADDSDLLCCEKCGEWQHMSCWDKKDASERRPRRNWAKEDFKCSSCLKKATKKPHRKSDTTKPAAKAKGGPPAKKGAAAGKASSSANPSSPSKPAAPKKSHKAKPKPVVPAPEANGSHPLLVAPPALSSQPQQQAPPARAPHQQQYPPPPPAHHSSHPQYPPHPAEANGHHHQQPYYPAPHHQQYPQTGYPSQPPLHQHPSSYAPPPTHHAQSSSGPYHAYADRPPPPPAHAYSHSPPQNNGHPSLPPISALQAHPSQPPPHLPPISYPGGGQGYYPPPSQQLPPPPQGMYPGQAYPHSHPDGSEVRRESWDGRAQ